jgi:hypothetical protein
MMPPLATVLAVLALAPPALADDGLPSPPSEAHKQYKAWRARLPRAMQWKIDQHCQVHGGDYQSVCNGIGPLAIPPPPVDYGGDDEERRDWLDSLTAPQRHYVAEYCAADHGEPHSLSRGYSTLCGGTPIVLTRLARHDLASLVSAGAGAQVFDSLLVSAAVNCDPASSLGSLATQRIGALFVVRVEPALAKP